MEGIRGFSARPKEGHRGRGTGLEENRSKGQAAYRPTTDTESGVIGQQDMTRDTESPPRVVVIDLA